MHLAPRIIAILQPTYILLVAFLGLGALVFAGCLIAFPKKFFKGQDAMGRGMAVGCMAVVMWGVCGLFGLAAGGALLIGWPEYSATTRIVGLLPLMLFATLGIGTWVSYRIGRARSFRRERAAHLAIPIYIIISDSDEESTLLYNTLREVDSVTEMQVFSHPLALRHQFEDHLPRAKVLSLKAWTHPRPGEEDLRNTPLILAKDLAEEKATFPILLYGQNAADLDTIEKILAPKWTVHRLQTSGPDWVAAQWLPAVRALIALPPQPVEPAPA